MAASCPWHLESGFGMESLRVPTRSRSGELSGVVTWNTCGIIEIDVIL